MILSAQSIRKRGIFSPFMERSKAFGMTFGLGPAGYDVRLAEEVEMDPGSFQLASTLEHFDMPLDVLGVVHDKSTLARMGLAIQNTVIEPGWRGYLTLELTNHNNIASIRKGIIRLKAGSPIAQIVLHQLDEATELPYSGRYQDQPAGANAPLLIKD